MISDYTLSVLDECDKDTLHRICDELLQLREEKRQAEEAREIAELKRLQAKCPTTERGEA